ncbi:hypothetical protein PoB_001335400 [Plakobranchus ocellatus]|uniref:Uncharacterized protein n=1 Tax=Plakobranchus ocellatus TaxID=259542 RepID=A0AAV3YUV5_9GAST|nr:hypothetical protein PoB_001335400 [Plakobranchus ocellatus]
MTLDLAGCSDHPKNTSLTFPLDLAVVPLTNSPTSSRPTTPSLKDVFLNCLTPVLSKPKKSKANRQKAVQRLYGESLTSAECVQCLEEEAAAKESKKSSPREGLGQTACEENSKGGGTCYHYLR